METLCLGEALVELVAGGAVGPRGEAPRMRREPAGAAVGLARRLVRLGVPAALAGGAGDDDAGRFLRDRLAADGVGLAYFHLRAGVRTPLAFARSGGGGREVRGDATDAVVGALPEDEADAAVDAAAALVLGSATLVGEAARAVTMRARERALAAGIPVIVDVGLALDRWRTAADAAARVNACVPGALLVLARGDDAERLTGEPDPERAALALRKAGARLVVVARGRDGAILRGEERAEAGAAGPALAGTLVARLALAGFYPAAAAAAFAEAAA